jgi:hypothetical protein
MIVSKYIVFLVICGVVVVTVITCLLISHQHSKYSTLSMHSDIRRVLFQWTSSHPVPVNSLFVDNKCEYNGAPICCALLSEVGPVDHDTTPSLHGDSALCSLNKTYVPSTYELRHYQMAVEIAKVSDFSRRLDMFVDYIIADIPHANKWLERVRIHMQNFEVSCCAL